MDYIWYIMAFNVLYMDHYEKSNRLDIIEVI
jgi:hypothetical protein